MILDWILNAAQTLITTVFSILPNLPPMPSQITDSCDWLVNMVSHSTGVLKYIYTPVLFNIIIGLVVTLLLFEQIYHLGMWLLKKIPIIDVK
jgi:hypothetical protein